MGLDSYCIPGSRRPGRQRVWPGQRSAPPDRAERNIYPDICFTNIVIANSFFKIRTIFVVLNSHVHAAPNCFVVQNCIPLKTSITQSIGFVNIFFLLIKNYLIFSLIRKPPLVYVNHQKASTIGIWVTITAVYSAMQKYVLFFV